MTYQPRADVNVSEFINGLNMVNPEQDTSTELSFPSFENDPFFSHNGSQFFDFDLGATADLQVQQPYEFKAPISSPPQLTGTTTDAETFEAADFNLQEFGQFATPPAPYQAQAPMTLAATQPIYTPPQHGVLSAQTSNKRKASESVDTPSSVDMDDQARVAADEDKRRRNTAASARFRVKKKQREQALEKSAKEMQDKMAALENKVSQLERENKWLKSLVIEKKDTKTAEDLALMYQKFRESETESSKAGANKDGVGTKVKA